MSKNHTYVSYELSKKAGHGKKNIKFEDNYLPNIDKAIERARLFSLDRNELLDNVGTNVGELIEAMRSNKGYDS